MCNEKGGCWFFFFVGWMLLCVCGCISFGVV